MIGVARRELSALLDAPLGWWVAAGWMLAAGLFWVAMVDRYAVASLDQVYSPYAAAQVDPMTHLIAPWYANLGVLLLVAAPVVTMRLVAEEARSGTLELLLSSPATAAELVLGKLLGAWSYLLLLLAGVVWMPLLLRQHVDVDLGAWATGAAALGLMAGVVAAVGLLASAMTESPTAAMMLSFSAALCLWIVGWVDPDPTSVWTQLSLSGHLQSGLMGLVRPSDVAYDLLVIGWCALAASVRLEGHRDP